MEIQSNISSQTKFFGLSKSWQGAFWKIVSCACFAGINGIVRYLSSGIHDETIVTLPVNVMMFFQNAFGALFLLPWIFKVGLKNMATHYPSLHFIRVVTAVLGIYLWYLALKTIPIAESVALNFTGPIFTVMGAWLLLQERMDFYRLLAVFLSVIGAVIISCPHIPFSDNTHSVGLYALLPISSAFLLVINKLLTRKLATLGETPACLAIYLLLLMAPVSLLFAVYEWQTPDIQHWPWLILLGLLATAAHLSFSKAYQLAEVTFLMPLGFSKFFLSTLIGYLAFSELPTHWSLWIGIFIIFFSIGLLGWTKSFSKR